MPGGSLWNRIASSSAGFRARTSNGCSSSHCAGTWRRKYGNPQATVMPRPAGVAGYFASNVASACSRSSCAAREVVRCDRAGDDSVVERRHEHLDPVVGDDLHAVEQVLFGRQRRAGRRSRGGRRVAVDERVDAGGPGDRSRRARDGLPPGDAHQAGRTSTSPLIMRFRLATTFEKLSGGATCSLIV